jgi:hypothetical protein
MRHVWPTAFACIAIATVTFLGVAGCTAEAVTRPPVTPAATTVGASQSCIPLHQLRETRIRDDWTIDFIAETGNVWRNALTSRCSGLKISNAITYETSLSELCSADIVYVLETTPDLHRGASCSLGQFVPVKLQKYPRRSRAQQQGVTKAIRPPV